MLQEQTSPLPTISDLLVSLDEIALQRFIANTTPGPGAWKLWRMSFSHELTVLADRTVRDMAIASITGGVSSIRTDLSSFGTALAIGRGTVSFGEEMPPDATYTSYLGHTRTGVLYKAWAESAKTQGDVMSRYFRYENAIFSFWSPFRSPAIVLPQTFTFSGWVLAYGVPS